MSFDIDIILGVQLELNNNTNFYELLFEVVLHSPLKYCRIFESDIARKTLAKHKMFTDICQELNITQNIHHLRKCMDGRISMIHLNIFRNSRVQQMKERWTMLAHKIILTSAKKKTGEHKKNMHEKVRTKRRYKRRKCKNNKKINNKYSGGYNVNTNEEYENLLRIPKVTSFKTKKNKKVDIKLELKKKSENRRRKKQSETVVKEEELAETLKKRQKLGGNDCLPMMGNMNFFIPGIKQFVKANVIALQQLNDIEKKDCKANNPLTHTMQQTMQRAGILDKMQSIVKNMHQPTIPSNGIPPCIVGIHLYNEHPNLAVYRKQNIKTWIAQFQQMQSHMKNKNVVHQMSASLLNVQKLMAELNSETQMISHQQFTFNQKSVQCQQQYLAWKEDWIAKKAQLDQRLKECESEKEQVLRKMAEFNEVIRQAMSMVERADDIKTCMIIDLLSNEKAKDINNQLIEGMEKIHELENIQESIFTRIAFYRKTSVSFDESLEKNTIEYKRFCQKMEFVSNYGSILLRSKYRMIRGAQELEKSFLVAISTGRKQNMRVYQNQAIL